MPIAVLSTEISVVLNHMRCVTVLQYRLGHRDFLPVSKTVLDFPHSIHFSKQNAERPHPPRRRTFKRVWFKIFIHFYREATSSSIQSLYISYSSQQQNRFPCLTYSFPLPSHESQQFYISFSLVYTWLLFSIYTYVYHLTPAPLSYFS